MLDGVRPLLENLQRSRNTYGFGNREYGSHCMVKIEKVGLNQYFKFGGFGERVLKEVVWLKMLLKSRKKNWINR